MIEKIRKMKNEKGFTLVELSDATVSEIKKLAEVSGTINSIEYNADGVITKVNYTSKGWTCEYTKDGGYGEPTHAN